MAKRSAASASTAAPEDAAREQLVIDLMAIPARAAKKPVLRISFARS